MRPFVKPGAPLEATRTVPAMLRMGAAIAGWLVLWFAPWPAWLGSNLWLKVGVALAAFLLPGAFLYLLASRGESVRFRGVTSGFVFSHLLVAVLGTFGRIFQLSFPFVKHTFMALGLVMMAAYFLGNRRRSRLVPSLTTVLSGYASYWPLALVAALAMLMTVQRALTSDDFAYLAHLTNWQRMQGLHFNDLYFGVDRVESTRFWIVSTPFSQALLADIGQTPGLLLLGGYYEPFLAFLAILCFYDLARTAGLSKQAAMASVALQIMFLALLSVDRQPGAPFFQQLSTDKATAAYLVAPVFISFAIEFLARPQKGSLLNLSLSGASLGLMHPVLAAFAVFIVAAMAVFGARREDFKRRALVILVGVAILLPQIGVRLVRHEAQPEIPSSADSLAQARGIESFINRIENTPFYGFNPGILALRIPYQDRLPFPAPLVAWAWMAAPLAVALFALKGFRKDPLKQYLLAATSLVVLAGVPYTGWLLGIFVSAWMLERAAWLYPFGISAVFLLLALREETRFGRYLNRWQSARAFAWAPLWSLSILLILLAMREQGLPDLARLEGATRRYQALTAVGQYLDQHAPGPVVVAGPDDLNDFIPALSWKAKVISFRPEDSAYPYFFTKKERLARLLDRQALFSNQTPLEKRMNILRKYGIRYILIESTRMNRLRDLLESDPENFKILGFGRYALVEISGLQ